MNPVNRILGSDVSKNKVLCPYCRSSLVSHYGQHFKPLERARYNMWQCNKCGETFETRI